MITIVVSGSFSRLEAFLRKISSDDIFLDLDQYAREGVAALASATPVDSGLAASSWGYEIVHSKGMYTIYWTNKDVENGFPVAIMLQYGHATGSGGYVQGVDYINPAIKPIFDKIQYKVWKAVTSG